MNDEMNDDVMPITDVLPVSWLLAFVTAPSITHNRREYWETPVCLPSSAPYLVMMKVYHLLLPLPGTSMTTSSTTVASFMFVRSSKSQLRPFCTERHRRFDFGVRTVVKVQVLVPVQVEVFIMFPNDRRIPTIFSQPLNKKKADFTDNRMRWRR
jgi:hypothetical protein